MLHVFKNYMVQWKVKTKLVPNAALDSCVAHHVAVIPATLFVMHVYKSLEVNVLRSVITKELIVETENI